MLKKSDILALLDRLPDEFEPDAFRDAFDELSAPPVPQWQLDAAYEALERSKVEGTHTMEEFEARMDACLSKFTSQKSR